MNFRRSSIRSRLLLMVLPLVILSLGTVVGLSYYYSSQFLSKSIDETAVSIGADYSNQIRGVINERVIELEGLASNQVMHSSHDQAQVVKSLNDTYKRTGNFDNINALFPDGSGVRFNGTTTNVADRDYVKMVVSTKKLYISEPGLTRGTGKIGLIIAVPVLEDNNLVKIITGNISLQRVNDLIKEVKFKDNGYAVLIDDSGMILADARRPELNGKFNVVTKKLDPELQMQKVEFDDHYNKLFAEAKTGKRVSGSYVDLDRTENIGIFTPVKLPGGQQWIMVVSAPKTEVTREVAVLSKIMLWVVFLCIILTTIVITYVSHKFASPIVLMRDEALLLAQGDLTQRQVNIDSNDEIGQLAHAFREMAENLRHLVVQVQLQADTIAASSEQLTASAQQSAQAENQVAASITEIAQGTERQSVSITSMAAVAEEIAASIGEIANTGKIIGETANLSMKETERGYRAIDQAMAQMKQINQGSESVGRVIGELAKGSQEISEIVSLIASIAGQTNLLALNAAIEAARAGEQGRGFAVVADEVRKLAEGSNQAAKQIAELIKKNEIDMNETIMATRTNNEAVNAGINVVGIAGQVFKEISSSVTNLSDQISEISDSIDQIAVGSQGLADTIHIVNMESKTNAVEALTISAASEEQLASIEEIASASQVLAKISCELQHVIVNFKV
ncbi:methyl-accepting chemotaxis protein [Pelosinus sp. sgz500959]|uniref:methyl-accepting chemotaxis protein n=1 Tax=Pelosinus sp. sgz500959 TaxID=3242472 RepID=UPI00366CAE92